MERVISDHDRLIRIDERSHKMEGDITEIKEWMANRPCPADLCHEHNNRITSLEKTATFQWIAIGASVGFTAIVLSMLWGHVSDGGVLGLILSTVNGWL